MVGALPGNSKRRVTFAHESCGRWAETSGMPQRVPREPFMDPSGFRQILDEQGPRRFKAYRPSPIPSEQITADAFSELGPVLYRSEGIVADADDPANPVFPSLENIDASFGQVNSGKPGVQQLSKPHTGAQ